jgi:hypothetical protein
MTGRGKPTPVPLCPQQIPHDPGSNLGSNPSDRSGKPATNRMGYGAPMSPFKFAGYFNSHNLDSRTVGLAVDSASNTKQCPESSWGKGRSAGT